MRAARRAWPLPRRAGARGVHIASLLAHAGCEVDATTGALTPPIHLSSTFERDPDNEYRRGFVYARANNPTRALLERELARLEGGGGAVTFGSGMAAGAAVVQALCAPGDTVLIPDDAYHGLRHLLANVYARWGLRAEQVDMSDARALEAALDGAASDSRVALCWLETPSNPMLKLTDVSAASAACAARGVPCVVDATWCTPALLRPLELGPVDLVLHSSTKYLGGHSDLTGGVVVGARGAADAADDDAAPPPLIERVREVQVLAGSGQAPFDCWLLLRGLRSLGARVPLHSANALRVARLLADHPAVAAVHYPGLEAHPQHALARDQFGDRGFGGMLSFQCAGGRDAAVAVAAATRLFKRATSLGGTESLIEHRASIEAPPTATPDDLLRVSVGLEHADDLIDDLRAALDAVA